MADILVLLAHPHIRLSRANASMLRALAPLTSPQPTEPTATRSAAAPHPSTEIRDLYALYPDFYIDIAAEQAALTKARLVVWQHPLHWYGMPALMKLWLDEVLSFGWAYGPDGHALRGKWLWPVLSTGGTEESYSPEGYNRFSLETFLSPYRQTATLCGMHWRAPLVLHGAHRAFDAAIDAHAERYLSGLRQFPEWSSTGTLGADAGGEVPASARPGVPKG
jgi:glutathione-regulated potassium-efflux system ancillary protein KefF